MPLSAGVKLGDCEILGPLGSGGMGEIYRARDNSLDREVAIKVLPEQLAGNPDKLRRFEQEARAAAALSHPNIIVVYRFGADQGVHYVVSELLQGQTLRERMQGGPIPPRKTLDYALQVARGLAAAHERGIVHRDLKPENIFLTRDGIVKILDFGLAKITSIESDEATRSVHLTQPGVVMGTVGYMSPEQVRGLAVDQRSDLFSLGAILYEMLSANRAFQGTTAADTMSSILKEEPPDLAALPNLPPALARLVHRCLEKDPGDRFQSARDLAFNFELLSRDSGSGSAAVAVSTPPTLRRIRPAIAVLALALAAAMGFLAAHWRPTPARDTGPVTLRRLTDFVGMEEGPALSPDGKAVAFTAQVGEHRQVWMRLLAGGNPLQVTHDEADHEAPRWAADSATLIYFSPATDASAGGQVWEIPALGGTARPIVSSLIPADISHDGKHIAFLRPNQNQLELVVADRDGSALRVVSTLPGGYIYSNLRWSPDDTRLAYQSGRTFDFDVFYMPVSGGKPQAITHDDNPQAGFAWLPDGSGVVFSTSRGNTVLYMPTMNLWTASLASGEMRQLTFGEISYMSPDVDRDRNIVASRTRIQLDLWKYPADGAGVDNVRRGVQITHQTGSVLVPSTSPTGRELVYLSDSGGHGNLWILNLETGQSRQLTFERDPRVMVGVPVWSPDAVHISYVVRSAAGWNVDGWVINADGNNAHKVSAGGGWACWSADGRWLYVSPPAENGFRIDKMYADGSHVTSVRAEGEKPAVAPDGTLYYVLNHATLNGVADMEIRKAHPDNGESKSLVTVPGSRLSSSTMLTQPVISPDGKWLAILLRDGSTTNVWAQPTAGGEMHRLTDFGHEATFIARRVSWSPDGRYVYAAVGKGEADIVLLNNLAP